MTADEHLRELATLPHDARVRRMVELGQRAATHAATKDTLAVLERGGFYERYLALQSCFGSRDGDHILRALAEPSRTIRALAIPLVALACDDTQVRAALEAAPAYLRRELLRQLGKRGRFTLIDEFLDELAARDDEQLVVLLPFGSPQVVARHVDQLLPRAGLDDWRRLARRHPDVVAAALRSRAEAAEQVDRRLAQQANTVLPILANTRPDQAVDLTRALTQHIPFSWLDLRALIQRRPAEMADLVLQSSDRIRSSFELVAERLGIERLLALVERQIGLDSITEWLGRIKPEQRAAIYQAYGRGWRDNDGCLWPNIVKMLPRNLREQEGRRHLALPALAARPMQRLPYAAFLPWDEALATLDPFIRSPEPELRAAAYSAMADAARFHRERLGELLAMARARRNEQDPVRLALLTGLAALPPGRWSAEHLDDLSRLIRDALDAADLSQATAAAAERLIVSLLPFHSDWSASWLATLMQERAQINLYGLGARLTDDNMRRIAPALLPVLLAWETRELESQLISAAQSFGPRLRAFDEFVDIIERVLRRTVNPWIASQALWTVAQHRRERLATLVPALLREDPSWATQPVVYSYLHRHRQDLITPFLGQQVYSGRFSTGITRFVLPMTGGFHRWTSDQQAIFALTLDDQTAETQRVNPEVFVAIEQLAALPAVPPKRLIELAGLDNPRPQVRDRALRALGTLDAGQGTPTLLDALDDDRARIAIYALRRSLLAMPAAQALELLRAIPLEKITIAKEVVRLLGELRIEPAYRELLAIERRDLHRDVRVALLRALWNHLDREETWPILERAAEADDPALAAGLINIPADRLAPEAQRRLAALIAALIANADPKVRLDALLRCASVPLGDSEHALFPRLLDALESPIPDECSAAARALFATYAGRDAALVGQAISRITANRRGLRTTIQALLSQLVWQRTRLLPAARAALEAMDADPLTAVLRVEVATRALPWEELGDLLLRLTQRGELFADALVTAAQSLLSANSRADSAKLAELEARLAASDDERLRRLALAMLVAQAQPPHGWDDARLARLRAYCADQSVLVAAAAQFTLPPDEA